MRNLCTKQWAVVNGQQPMRRERHIVQKPQGGKRSLDDLKRDLLAIRREMAWETNRTAEICSPIPIRIRTAKRDVMWT